MLTESFWFIKVADKSKLFCFGGGDQKTEAGHGGSKYLKKMFVKLII